MEVMDGRSRVRGFVRIVAFFGLLFQGCAAIPPELEIPLARGQFVSRSGKPGLVIGAPHGGSDDGTDRISRELAERTGFGLVLATGFSNIDSQRRRFHVNRPTEGVPGQPPSSEVYTEEARTVYEAYVRRVKEAAQGPIRLFVELHGNARKESAGRIEIATVGVDRQQAWQLKTLFELIRDVHLKAWPEAPQLQVLMEPLDRLHLNASATKQTGILRLPQQALHIELPRSARSAGREAYVEILAEFLKETSNLFQAWNK